MKNILCIVLLSSCFIEYIYSSDIASSIDEPQFRYDYKYNEAVNGWFKIHKVPAGWHEAQNRCQLEGAEIATPLDNATLDAMMIELEGKMKSVYTGIHSIFSHGDYFSIKGIPLNQLPVTWAPNAPFADLNKRCVVLHQNGTITSDDCDAAFYPFVCFKKNNDKTLNECGTTDDEYTFMDKSNACYKFHPEVKTWNDAFMTCSAEGGHLVVINSDKELQALKLLFGPKAPSKRERRGVYNVFIGLINWESGEWVTIHGENLEEAGFSQWDHNQPDNENHNEYCGALVDLEKLNDTPCDLKLSFICEKKTDSLTKKNVGAMTVTITK